MFTEFELAVAEKVLDVFTYSEGYLVERFEPVCSDADVGWLKALLEIESGSVTRKDMIINGEVVEGVPFKKEDYGLETGLLVVNYNNHKYPFIVNFYDNSPVKRPLLVKLNDEELQSIPEIEIDTSDDGMEVMAEFLNVNFYSVEDSLVQLRDYYDGVVPLVTREEGFNQDSILWHVKYDLIRLKDNSEYSCDEKTEIYDQLLSDHLELLPDNPELLMEFVRFKSIVAENRLYDNEFELMENLGLGSSQKLNMLYRLLEISILTEDRCVRFEKIMELISLVPSDNNEIFKFIESGLKLKKRKLQEVLEVDKNNEIKKQIIDIEFLQSYIRR